MTKLERPFAQGVGPAASGGAARTAGPAVPDVDVELSVTVPLDLRLTLGIHRRGAGDPTMHLEPGRAWRATRTPEGAATTLITRLPGGAGVRVRAWGPGASWAAGAVPALLGLDDEPEALVLRHPVLADAVRRSPGLRIGRTAAVLEALVPAILEQKITGDEARRVFRALVVRLGEPAPGPGGLRVAPSAAVLADLPYHAYHPLGVERRRAELIRAVAGQAARVEATAALEPAAAYAWLQRFAGIGPWTAAEVGMRAYGDPDALSVGDFHLRNLVAFALAGEPRGTDERMVELLEPYRGQRGRVARLLEASGVQPPRYGPRASTRHIETW